MHTKLTILAAVVVLAACAARPVVTDVSFAAQGTTRASPPNTLPGVPMRIKTEQLVHIFRYDPDKDAYDEVSTARQVLADPIRLFAVDVVSWPFASPSLHITENADNTPKLIQTTSTQNQSGAIDAVSSALTSVTSAQNTKTAACQTSNAAAVTADQAAATAKAAYDALPASATPQLKAAYQAVIDSAQQAANYARSAPACR